jgi:hypothetical protein
MAEIIKSNLPQAAIVSDRTGQTSGRVSLPFVFWVVFAVPCAYHSRTRGQGIRAEHPGQ